MPKIISIGNTCVDLILSCTKQLPQWNSEIIFPYTESRLGGQAANFAIATSCLGLRPILVSSLGTDPVGDQLRTELVSIRSIDNRFLLRENSKTGFSVTLVRNDGERSFLTFLGHQKLFTIRPIMKRVLSLIENDDIVHVSGLNVLPKLQKDLYMIGKQLQTAGARVSLDSGWPTGRFGQKEREAFYKVLSHVDFYEPNDAELMKLSGKKNVGLAALAVKRRYNGSLVVKLGTRGSSIFYPSGTVTTVRSYATRAKDTTGAGDAFDAGFVTGIIQNHDLEYCARMGNATASIAISRVGTPTFRYPKLLEVINLIEKRR